jgi:ATP-dependent DNA helicase RecQ
MRVASIAEARSLLQDTFGYPDFRPGQIDVVTSVLAGSDTLGVLPTGGGKSLCYQVPALVRDGLTVVISPLISLMKDQVERLESRGVSATYLNSTLDDGEADSRLLQVLDGEIRLLYVAPERLESGDLRRCLQACRVTLLAVDEAHCISEWGHEFRPAFRRIAEVAKELGPPQIIALTATATPAVRADIVKQLRLRSPNVIVGGFDRTNLDYEVHHCESHDAKEEALVRVIRTSQRPAIVYASTRSAVEQVARRLTRAGIRTLPYHGGLSDFARSEVQDEFMRGDVDTIAATNAFGMGVDKPNVRLVVHWSMPGTLEAYYQEAGRAGRDGARSRCVLLHCDGDRETHEWFIRGTFPSQEIVRDVTFTLQAMRYDDHVPSNIAMIARTCDKADARQVRAVFDLLVREGLLTPPRESGIAWIRLLATPARIRRELGADATEIAILRSLWRIGSDALQSGTMVSLNQLAPLSQRAVRRALKTLRDRQFVDFSINTSDYTAKTDVALSEVALDWPRLNRRRDAELGRLDMMEGYAVTDQCRRAFVLGYFGERETGAHCAGCDNCRRRLTESAG